MSRGLGALQRTIVRALAAYARSHGGGVNVERRRLRDGLVEQGYLPANINRALRGLRQMHVIFLDRTRTRLLVSERANLPEKEVLGLLREAQNARPNTDEDDPSGSRKPSDDGG